MKIEYFFDDIESCECIGEFNDEYVYDLEVADDTHTFIANDILIHNSLYVSFGDVWNAQTGYTGTPVEFIQAIYKHRLDEFFQKTHDSYAKKWGTKNIQGFEMEAIAETAIWTAKKKYVTDLIWKEGGEFGISYTSGEKLKFVGLETAQSSFPEFGRNRLKELITYLVMNENFKIGKFISKLKRIKEEFKLQDIENISEIKGMSDYNKYVLDDRRGVRLAKGCPMHVRSAAIHNFTINNSKYKTKYNLIKAGNRVKFYQVKDGSRGLEVFGFIPGEYPIEVAPQIDYDIMFRKIILDPINRFMVALEQNEISENLVHSVRLF